MENTKKNVQSKCEMIYFSIKVDLDLTFQLKILGVQVLYLWVRTPLKSVLTDYMRNNFQGQLSLLRVLKMLEPGSTESVQASFINLSRNSMFRNTWCPTGTNNHQIQIKCVGSLLTCHPPMPRSPLQKDSIQFVELVTLGPDTV